MCYNSYTSGTSVYTLSQKDWHVAIWQTINTSYMFIIPKYEVVYYFLF